MKRVWLWVVAVAAGLLSVGAAQLPRWSRARLDAQAHAHEVSAAGTAPAASTTTVGQRAGTGMLVVPRARGPITVDGELDDPGWQSGAVARTGAFVDGNRQPAHPYSEARFVRDDGHLYVALYAADEDLRARRTKHDDSVWMDDSFHLLFSNANGDRSFDVSPLGTLTDGLRTRSSAAVATPPTTSRRFDFTWESGAVAAADVDGTLNDASDDDEEWVVEMAIPLAALELSARAGARVTTMLRRCDTPKASPRGCATWGETALVLGD